MKKRNSNLLGNQVMVEGLMAFGKLETGEHTMDFACCEDVVAEPFEGDFRVQAMRDGNVYMQQKRKRIKNKPLFRDDNASLSHGRDGRWYFYFSMDENRLGDLPAQLVRQAGTIAQKVRELIHN